MFILPLGLGTKIRRVPVVSLLLAAAWICVFFFDRSQARVTDGIFNAAARSGIKDAARNLFQEYCEAHSGKPKLCARYAVLIKTGFPSKAPIRRGVARLSFEDYENLGKEQHLAAGLRDHFSHCGSSKRCFLYKDLIWSFATARTKLNESLQHLGSYSTYLKAEKNYLGELRRVCLNAQCLVKGNVNFGSVIWSQMRHGSLTHLMGNIFALLIFGIYAEQRTRRWIYLISILSAGSVGMIIHAYYFSGRDTISLGGSAIVSAVMGMFYVFFFHTKMRFLVWLPRKIYWGTSYYVEIRYAFPLLFVLADIAGSLDSGFSELHLGTVAHMAHIFGFMAGVGVGLIIRTLRQLPASLLYESEIDDLLHLESMRGLANQLKFADEMLARNPDNLRARALGCAAALRWMPHDSREQNAALGAQTDRFLKNHLAEFCSRSIERGSVMTANKLLEKLPIGVPYQVILANLKQSTLVTLINVAVKTGQIWLSLRLADMLLLQFTLSKRYDEVASHAADLIASLPLTTTNMRSVSAYLKTHPNMPLSDRFGAWLSNAQEELKAS
ncbi:MAG: rhomboid family intramembrane serine protease [Deltaproteobacteria bacterium]|nr:rhomboid family intramembrane serine protease [Deltaproteobacteria bacterium]